MSSRCEDPCLQYVIVATSEPVVNLRGPAMQVGNLATTLSSLSMMIIKDLLKPPSFFSYRTTLVASEHSSTAFSQSAAKSN